MILIPDDEPELSLPAASEEFLPALSGDNAPVSPAGPTCFHSIPTAARQTMASFLKHSSPLCSELPPWSPAAGAACGAIT
ncbi:Uncharacterised protein [Kluyvera cryocrescens]|uniref:Uncharacterized protein n=1 Tax=Kluyvera cryocrescens TaxID=580 RepID=A0A485C5N2_KLUCR|nr:Uncharacterised protein [Kluyvera cryocrescens]